MLVDPDALTAFAGERLPGEGPLDVERLSAGHSNLTFVVRRGDFEWILRRPPQGPLLPTAHDVIREYRVLDLLARSGRGVRVPTVTLACEDPEVIGAPFYLMERVDGEVIRTSLPEWASEDVRRTIGFELVDALAELHSVPVEPFVEAGLGKPSGYLERQLRRWRGQREGAKTRDLPDYDVLSDWLEHNLPMQAGTSLVHGDYKLDNVAMSPLGPRLTAILDWEMATVGDPMADLGYLMSFWIEPGERDEFSEVAGNVTVQPGFPTREEMVARYAARSGRDVSDLRAYVVLAIWKLAILLEGSYSRHLAGTTDDPFFALLDRGVPALLARARAVAGA
ncbi:MAG TPA: phosphotransferase [Frankiaceae bacterium]|nr:phosphotransferase [Frankiaceae bacterium]